MKKLLLFSILTWKYFFAYNQITPPPDVISPSPVSQSFARFGSYPVNLSSGLVDISIPLYEVKVGDISVPITLRYHASGIKFTDEDFPTGLGWNLFAGGRISRSIRGNEDEKSMLEKVKPASQIGTDVNGVYYMESLLTGTRDGEFDIFDYSFPTENGKFILEKESGAFKPVLIPFKPVKLDYKLTNGHFEHFTMLDSRGVKYRFGEPLQAGNTPFFETEGWEGRTNAWMLSDIVSTNGIDNISISYQHINFNMGLGLMFFKSKYTDLLLIRDDFGNGHLKGVCGLMETTGIFETDLVTYNPTTIYNTVLVPKEINAKDVRVTFEVANNYIDKIRVYRKNGDGSLKQIKMIKFFYSSYTIYSKKKLDSLRIYDQEENDYQRYSFEYEQSYQFPNTNNYKGLDFWGYNNGASNNSLLPPWQISVTAITASHVTAGSGNRNSYDAPMQAHVLKKIIYPTGGQTEFEYEANRYLSGSTIKLAGGLRIKSIKNYTRPGELSDVRTFKYGLSENSAGIASIVPHYKYFLTTKLAVAREVGGSTGTQRHRTVSSEFTSDFALGSLSKGSVLYDHVTEYFGDKNNNTGKIEHSFEIPVTQPFILTAPNVLPLEDQVPLVYNDYYDWFGVNPISEKIYTKNGNSYTLIKEIINTYANFNYEEHRGLKYNRYFEVLCYHDIAPSPNYQYDAQLTADGISVASGYPSGVNAVYNYGDYFVSTGARKLTKQEISEYSQSSGNKLVTVNDYYYENLDYLQISKETSKDSKNRTQEKRFRYPYDFPGGATVTGEMVNRNIINQPLEIIEKINNNPKTKTNINYEFSWFPDKHIIAPQSVTRQFGTYPSEIDFEYNAYDSYGNLLSQQKTKDIKNSYEWGYQNSYPIVEIKNAENSLATTTTTGTTIGTLNLPGNLATASFTSTAAGNIVLAALPDPGSTYSISYSLTGPSNKSGYLCVSRSSASCSYPETVTLTGMPAGVYNLTITYYSGNSPYKGASYIYPVSQTTTTGIKEFFFEGFEENPSSSAVTGTAHSGRKYWNGSYTVPFSKPNSRTYIIQWWKLTGGKWQMNQQTFTNNMVLTGTVDDIRVFPSDAMMTTYTYDPLIGMTSQTDPSGKMITYEYDGFGRLKTVLDQDKNVLKTMDYQYQAPNNQ